MGILFNVARAIALVGFLVGLAGSLFLTQATWIERLAIAAITSAITFVAVVLLGRRDTAQHRAKVRTVRARLLSIVDSSDEQFLAAQPTDDAPLLLETRRAIAQFFDVPSAKVHRDVKLIDDLCVGRLDMDLEFWVFDYVIHALRVESGTYTYTFTMATSNSIDDFAQAIREAIDRGAG